MYILYRGLYETHHCEAANTQGCHLGYTATLSQRFLHSSLAQKPTNLTSDIKQSKQKPSNKVEQDIKAPKQRKTSEVLTLR